MMKERIALRRAINAELARVHHCSDPQDPAFKIRILIRILFSSIDAYCHYLKEWILQYSACVEFSNNELEVLREGYDRQSYNGTVEFIEKPIKAKQNLLTTMRCLARTQSVDSPLPASGDVVPEFQTALNVRNRITHPKSATDFIISKTEAEETASAVRWFLELVHWASELEDAYFDSIGKEIQQSNGQQIDTINRNRPDNDGM